MLTDRDDRRHKLSGPLARESTIFTLFLPEERLGAIAYTWVTGENKASSFIAVFGDNNEQLLNHVVADVEMPETADFDDWTVGPMTVRHGEPHRYAHVSFDQDGVALDYTFEALSPPFSYLDNADGCPSFLADDRLEQSGYVRGTLTVGGRTIDFDTTGHRDHSWGVRDWDAFHHYKWINIQGENGIGINLMHVLALDRTWHLGYVYKDGELGPVKHIAADIARDDGWSYTGGHIVIDDELGRATVVEIGDRTSLAIWPAGSLVSRDGASRCAIDGVPGITHVEEGWKPDYVDQRIKLRKLGLG